MEEHGPELLATLTTMQRNTVDTEGWITPLRKTLNDIEAEEATWQPAPDERSIWEIVLHVEAWTDWAVHFLRGEDTDVTDWPPVGTESWAATQQRVASSLAAFEDGIAAVSAASLFASPTPSVTPTSRLLGIASILVHNAYHAGQLTKLRERYRSVLVVDGLH
ncbi:DinB family protein [Armatimonas sp.]|uniref:DinB family protein n=1 Tax=Armatimonas sp. TaxID=1872638 RepID=UPI0037509FA3